LEIAASFELAYYANSFVVVPGEIENDYIEDPSAVAAVVCDSSWDLPKASDFLENFEDTSFSSIYFAYLFGWYLLKRHRTNS
jgi:hypothetical protein